MPEVICDVKPVSAQANVDTKSHPLKSKIVYHLNYFTIINNDKDGVNLLTMLMVQ